MVSVLQVHFVHISGALNIQYAAKYTVAGFACIMSLHIFEMVSTVQLDCSMIMHGYCYLILILIPPGCTGLCEPGVQWVPGQCQPGHSVML